MPRFGRGPVLVGGTLTMIVGTLLTLGSSLAMVAGGLLILTAGAFVAHATASAWVGHRARVGRAQATALYNVAFYTGSAVIGWLVGFAWVGGGWPATVGAVVALALVAAGVAVLAGRRLRSTGGAAEE